MDRHFEDHSLGVKVTFDNSFGEKVTKYIDNGTISAWITQVTYDELLAHGFDVNDVSHLMLTDTLKKIVRGDMIDNIYEVQEVVIGHKYTKVYLKRIEEEEYVEYDESYDDGYDEGYDVGYEDGYEAGSGGGGAGSWSQLPGKPFETIGQNLKVVNGALKVDTATAVEEDNTKPITSAAVHVEVGNINVLLQTI